MANYIKIRDLTPYPANAQHTGVYSGDMFAMALNTTGPGSPHAIDGTQRASVRQVIESYNTTVAQNSQPPAGVAPGPSNQPGVVKDEDGTVLDGGPSLTPSTFASYVTIGGGLDYKETCITNPDDATQTICTYGLELATSASSTVFTLVVSGGAVDTEFQITSNGWVSGRFKDVYSATSWMNSNISSAKQVKFLLAGDIQETRAKNSLNISNKSLEQIYYMDYGGYALSWDRNTSKAANGNPQWVDGYENSYNINDVVQYTGMNDGTMGDFNIYRCNSDNPGNGDPISNASWDRMTPAMTTGLTTEDPNGFLPNNPLFATRASWTVLPESYSHGGGGYAWYAHGGDTSFINLKMIFPYCNMSAVYPGSIMGKIFRKQGVAGFFNIGPGVEMHLGGSHLSQVFELIEGTPLRVFGNQGWGNASVPDAWNVTGAAGTYCPIPSLYLSLSGLNVGGWSYGSGIGSIVQATQGAEASMGREYWARPEYGGTMNGTMENSRLQFGSGLNQLTCCVEAISASECQGNTSMAMSPTTTFKAGGINLYQNLTGYRALGYEGLGRRADGFAFPNIAPIAARQFCSNNVGLDSRSGFRDGTNGHVNTLVTWVGNIENNISSGDAFSSSAFITPSASTAQGLPVNGAIGLGEYTRYPDSLPANFNPGKTTAPY